MLSGRCVPETDSLDVVDGRCGPCLDGHFFDRVRYAPCNAHYTRCLSLARYERCEFGFVRNGGMCVAVGDGIAHCAARVDDGCQRCDDGFILTEDATWGPCSSACATCFGSPSNCIACHNWSMLVTDDATNATTCRELGDSCRAVLRSSEGRCAIFEAGYFRHDRRAARATRTARAARRRRRTASPAKFLHERVPRALHPTERRRPLP